MWSLMPVAVASRPRRRLAPPLTAALVALLCALPPLAAGCATGTALRRGQAAEAAQDYDRAVVEYTKAVREHPSDQHLRLALERARLRAAELHFNRARRLSASGKLEDAVVEYQIAVQMNPSCNDCEESLRVARAQLRAKVAVTREGRTELETLIDRTRDLPPPGLDLPRGLKVPASLVFRDASSRDVFTALARFADVSLVFDPTFKETPVTIDLRNASFEEALAAVAASTGSFYRMVGPRTVTVIPDTPAKRREYEEEVVRTFYLSNADVKETIDLLRLVIELRRIAPITGTNAISIKDTPERVQAAGRLITAIDKARAEVVIDVELLEVDRTSLQEFGLQVASPGEVGISGAADINQSYLTLYDLKNLTPAGVFLTGFPAIYYRLLRNDTSTRTLANPQLRTSEGVAAQAKFGDRVPVPTTTFSPIATGGVNQQPITSFNYENIGVNIDITPRTHHNDDVSLGLKIELSTISGTGYGGLPTFGNREVSTTIRLHDGETTVLAGLIRDDERTVLEGIPGLASIPVVGRLFAKNHKEKQETDIILTLTPHIIRVLDLTEADLLPFRVAKDAGTSLPELPVTETAAPPRDAPKIIKPPGATPR
jgi:general secretion pathway protein D